MTERLSDKLHEFLKTCEGRDVDLNYLRKELHIDPSSPSDANLRVLMTTTMVEKKLVVPSGKRDGIYHVVKSVSPIALFSVKRERRPVFNLNFPYDFDRQMELDFAENVIIREGDLITLGGVKSKGKTTLCLNFTARNVDIYPVLMGNEYSILVSDELTGTEYYEPAPRFYNRMDDMKEYTQWTDEEGNDKVTLLPVNADYAQHVVKNRLNIIDWVNLDGDKSYDISKVLGGIKSNIGRGVAIVALQKGEGAVNPRGGQYVRDFSDLEILLDGFGESEDDVMLTIKGCKEKTAPIVSRTYAYTIVGNGTKIINFREVKECPDCRGSKYVRQQKCVTCQGRGKTDR